MELGCCSCDAANQLLPRRHFLRERGECENTCQRDLFLSRLNACSAVKKVGLLAARPFSGLARSDWRARSAWTQVTLVPAGHCSVAVGGGTRRMEGLSPRSQMLLLT
jgi:hypothetical protein